MNDSSAIEAVIISDDVRRENNGKHILIGVYTGVIYVSKIPALFSTFAFYFEIRPHKLAYDKVTLEFRSPNGQAIVKMTGKVQIEKIDRPGGFAFRVSPLLLESEGEYQVWLGLDEEPELVKSIDLQLKSETTPT